MPFLDDGEGRLDRRLRVYLALEVVVVDKMGDVQFDDFGGDDLLSTGERDVSGAASS